MGTPVIIPLLSSNLEKTGRFRLIVKCLKPFGGKADCYGASEGLVRGPETSVEESTNQFGL